MSNVIIGNTKYSVMLMEYLEELGIIIDAFCVDKEFIKEQYLSGKMVISTDELLDNFDKKATTLYLGIGYNQLGRVKRKIFVKLKDQGFRFGNYVHPSAHINRSVVIGEGNVIFENVVIQRNTVIGDGNLFFSNAVIMHDDNIGSFNSFCACSVLNGFVNVDDCNFIGANATLKDHIKISGECLIGAGAYVHRD